MKTLKYQDLLVTELEEIEARIGQERMKEIYAELRVEGQEAMSRELVVQLISRHFGLWDRIKYLMRHRDLIIPFFIRIKQTSTTKAKENL